MSDEFNHSLRLDRVETEVAAIRGDIGAVTREVSSVKSDVKSLAGVLQRIETGVIRAQEKSEERSERNKPNLTAIISVLISVISILIGGAWLISGQLSSLGARTDELNRQREIHAAEQLAIQRRTERLEDFRMRDPVN